MRFVEINTERGRKLINIEKLVGIDEVYGGCLVRVEGQEAFVTTTLYRDLKEKILKEQGDV